MPGTGLQASHPLECGGLGCRPRTPHPSCLGRLQSGTEAQVPGSADPPRVPRVANVLASSESREQEVLSRNSNPHWRLGEGSSQAAASLRVAALLSPAGRGSTWPTVGSGVQRERRRHAWQPTALGDRRELGPCRQACGSAEPPPGAARPAPPGQDGGGRAATRATGARERWLPSPGPAPRPRAGSCASSGRRDPGARFLLFPRQPHCSTS